MRKGQCDAVWQINLNYIILSTNPWGTVAQRLERATDNRVLTGSNPTEAVRELLQFPLPHFASVFFPKETLKAVGPFLPCAVINRSEVKDLTTLGGICVTCCGLQNSTYSTLIKIMLW